MLRFIVSLFNRKSQSTEPILQNNLDARDWSAHKAACRAEKLRAAREQSIGFVPAILQHIDREYIKLLCLTALASICLSALAMGQTMQEQKACYDQAHKVAHKSVLLTVYNHYDARTKTCWIMEVTDTTIAPAKAGDPAFGSMFPMTRSEAEYFNNHYAGLYKDIIVFNAFEENSTDAYYIGPAQGSDACHVDDKQCHSLEEFNTLVKSRYHGF
jgi:hypothetical protein